MSEELLQTQYAQKRPIKVCLWDCEQVIYSFTKLPLASWIATHKEKAKNSLPFSDWDSFISGHQSFEDFCKKLCEQEEITFKKDYLREIQQALQEGVTRTYATTRQVMQKLSEQGIKNGIFADMAPCLNTTFLKEFPLDENLFFPSYKTGFLKRQKEAFILVKETLNIPFEHILLIDNKIAHIEVARSLGMPAILFNQNTILDTINSFIQENKSGFISRHYFLQNGAHRELLSKPSHTNEG